MDRGRDARGSDRVAGGGVKADRGLASGEALQEQLLAAEMMRRISWCGGANCRRSSCDHVLSIGHRGGTAVAVFLPALTFGTLLMPQLGIERRTFSSTFVTRYVHDDNGNVIETTYPNGLVILRTFDLADRETEVTWLAGDASGTIASSITWFPFGGLETWNLPYSSYQGSVTQDAGGRVTAIQLKNGTSVLESITYGYANDGNVSKLPAAVATPNVLHDSLSRLAQDRADAAGTSVQTYEYDVAGNRTSRNGSAYTYDTAPNNRLLAGEGRSYAFDAAGNVTSVTGVPVITTDDDGTVTAVETASGTTTYSRDYRNLRVTRAGAGGAGTFFYSPAGELVHQVPISV